MEKRIEDFFYFVDVILFDFFIARFLPVMIIFLFSFGGLVALTDSNWLGVFVSLAVILVGFLWVKKAKTVARILHITSGRRGSFWSKRLGRH